MRLVLAPMIETVEGQKMPQTYFFNLIADRGCQI
jgi:hypothetical protein